MDLHIHIPSLGLDSVVLHIQVQCHFRMHYQVPAPFLAGQCTLTSGFPACLAVLKAVMEEAAEHLVLAGFQLLQHFPSLFVVALDSFNKMNIKVLLKHSWGKEELGCTFEN